MLISATLSKPASCVEEKLGRPYEKIKIKAQSSADGTSYFVEMFTKTQVFHEHFSEDKATAFIKENAGITFKNCVQRTDKEEITTLANKKGKVSQLVKRLSVAQSQNINTTSLGKKYLISENKPVPFLILLGVMNSEGKVIASKYDKFRQINRFLEFIDDTVNSLSKTRSWTSENPLRIADFGCGKSYLTFAVHYFLTEIKQIPCEIEGLDLKESVINYCNEIAQKLGLKGLIFHTGNIADYSGKHTPDIVITLHACDKATDYALEYAVEKQAGAILSVPCCQHQINQQLQDSKNEIPEEFAPLLKWGIIKEKFSSLVTDALRGEWLESQGYKVQMLEFIDMEHTPKNILIRAIKKTGDDKNCGGDKNDFPELLTKLNIQPEIWK
ncbi:MAG: SAM-dependent methyltransferase [Treponema sp.]|nr:SAM-dependent methyltransferase [Treponema sp.]